MKKTLIIVLVVIIVAAGGLYYWKGTPAYSLAQLKKAVATQDSAKALTYFDTDSIFESLWSQSEVIIETSINEKISGGGPLMAKFADRIPAMQQQVMASAKPLAKQKFVEALTVSLSTPKSQTPEANTSTSINATLDEKPVVKVTGDVATITTPNGVTLVMKQQADRSWKITEIQGIFDSILKK